MRTEYRLKKGKLWKSTIKEDDDDVEETIIDSVWFLFDSYHKFMFTALWSIWPVFTFALVSMFTILCYKLSGTYTMEFFKYLISSTGTDFFIFVISCSDFIMSCFSPWNSYTDLIKLSVTSKLGDLLPSHPFCQFFVLSSNPKASLYWLSFALQVAVLL